MRKFAIGDVHPVKKESSFSEKKKQKDFYFPAASNWEAMAGLYPQPQE